MNIDYAISSPRFRIYPNKEQKRQIDVTLDAVRFVYNHFLSKGREQYRETGTFPSRFDMQGLLPALKKDIPWLAQADSVALQIAVQHLSWTFSNFMKRRAEGLRTKLHYKTWHEYSQSYRRANGHNHVAIVDGRLKISKVGLVKMKLTKPITGRIIAATITREGTDAQARYYVSFYYEPENPPPQLPLTGRAVGIDLGLKTFITTSDGQKIDMDDFYGKYRERLDSLYEKMDRQTSGSRRWEKTYAKVKRIKQKIIDSRRDFFNKTAYDLVCQYDIICIETLNTRNMVRLIPDMRYKIHDARFWEFVEILQKKCEQHGRQLIRVDRFYPSTQICSKCGVRYPAAKRLDVRHWTCPACGAEHDRDVNAAINILREGLQQMGPMEAA